MKRKGYLLVVFFLFFLLIIGTLNVQAENDDSPRTFVISDKSPYPGKFNATVGDHPVNTLFSIYIYLVNHGGNLKTQDEAQNVKVTLYREDGSILYSLPYQIIPEGVGFTTFSIYWPANEHVVLKVSGTILKNGNDHNVQAATAESNFFWIGKPNPTPQPGLGELIYEKEVL